MIKYSKSYQNIFLDYISIIERKLKKKNIVHNIRNALAQNDHQTVKVKYISKHQM